MPATPCYGTKVIDLFLIHNLRYPCPRFVDRFRSSGFPFHLLRLRLYCIVVEVVFHRPVYRTFWMDIVFVVQRYVATSESSLRIPSPGVWRLRIFWRWAAVYFQFFKKCQAKSGVNCTRPSFSSTEGWRLPDLCMFLLFFPFHQYNGENLKHSIVWPFEYVL